MRSKMLTTQAALAAVALLISSAAMGSLALVDCPETPGAEANGATPEHCAWGALPDNNPATEGAAINDVFAGLLGTDLDPFLFAAKAGDCTDCLAGFTLASGTSSDPEWDFWFQLLTPYTGQSVDFALLIKQPGGPSGEREVVYAWTGLTLDIDGFYNSFRGDYSHISAFIRGVNVSEPAPLALLGLGLLGVALLRRRIG